jgi:hypothetical protein
LSVAYNSSIVTSGLGMCLDAGNPRSYPGSGTNWYDVSGNLNTNSLINGPTYNSSNGGTLIFDGVNDYSSGTNTSSLYTGDMTAEAWIKVNASSLDWVRIVGTGGNSGNRTFGLWYATDRRILWQRYGAGDPSIYPTTPVLDIGSWYHVVATTTGSSHVLYLNGVSIGTGTGAGPWPASGEAITVGFAGFHTYTNSNIGIVRLYTVGLTATQVLQNFNANRGRYGI